MRTRALWIIGILLLVVVEILSLRSKPRPAAQTGPPKANTATPQSRPPIASADACVNRPRIAGDSIA